MTDPEKDLLIENLGELAGAMKNFADTRGNVVPGGARLWLLAAALGIPSIGSFGWTITREQPQTEAVASSAAAEVGQSMAAEVRSNNVGLERRITELEREVEDLAADCRAIHGDTLDGTRWLADIMAKDNPRAARKVETPDQWRDEE